MSNLLRCGLIAAGIVAAFIGGYFLRNAPARVSDSAAVASEVARPAPKTAVTRAFSGSTTGGPVVVVADRCMTDDFPPVILPPSNPRSDPKTETPDPNDPAFQMIKRELGIQTTVVDKSLPVPDVLVQAKKEDVPIAPPIPDVLPVPMAGSPTPRLEPPPVPNVPGVPRADPPPTFQSTKILVNTRDIAIDFEVTKMGLSKVKAVELWTTRDGGTNWAKTDEMQGCASPFKTRLGSEGEYGFKLEFVSESGRRSESQRIQSKVELDTMVPSANFDQIYRSPSMTDHTRIQWKMSDTNLDLGHVKLEYSIDATTWHLIHDGPIDQNSHWRRPAQPGGQLAFEQGYFRDWLPPQNLPYEVHFRLRVQDRAGNSTVIQTPTKVSIDQIAPEGKITGIRATPSNAEIGPMPRVVDSRQVFSFWDDVKFR